MWLKFLSLTNNKTFLIRFILISIIVGFITYFYFEYEDMKNEIVDLKTTEKVLIKEYEILFSEKNNQKVYYKSIIENIKNTQKIISSHRINEIKQKKYILKNVDKTQSFNKFFMDLKKMEVSRETK